MARFDPAALPEEALAFLDERHLATLTTLRSDGSPHVTPVGFTFDTSACLARVITFAGSRKAGHVRARPAQRVAVCQVDGGRWLTLEGPATLSEDRDTNAEGERRYALRYRQPRSRPDRVTILIAVDRIFGRA